MDPRSGIAHANLSAHRDHTVIHSIGPLSAPPRGSEPPSALCHHCPRTAGLGERSPRVHCNKIKPRLGPEQNQTTLGPFASKLLMRVWILLLCGKPTVAMLTASLGLLPLHSAVRVANNETSFTIIMRVDSYASTALNWRPVRPRASLKSIEKLIRLRRHQDPTTTGLRVIIQYSSLGPQRMCNSRQGIIQNIKKKGNNVTKTAVIQQGTQHLRSRSAPHDPKRASPTCRDSGPSERHERPCDRAPPHVTGPGTPGEGPCVLKAGQWPVAREAEAQKAMGLRPGGVMVHDAGGDPEGIASSRPGGSLEGRQASCFAYLPDRWAIRAAKAPGKMNADFGGGRMLERRPARRKDACEKHPGRSVGKERAFPPAGAVWVRKPRRWKALAPGPAGGERGGVVVREENGQIGGMTDARG